MLVHSEEYARRRDDSAFFSWRALDPGLVEAEYLATLGVFTPLDLLRLWSEATPRAIFPQRRVGCLEDGCEASFLALSADPSADFASTSRISLRVKDGRLLP